MMDAQAINSAFGKILTEHRLAAGLSQERLALASGVDRTYVGKVERGLHGPSLVSVVRLAGGLGMAPEQLVAAAMERTTEK